MNLRGYTHAPGQVLRTCESGDAAWLMLMNADGPAMPDTSRPTARDIVTRHLVSQCKRFPELALGHLDTLGLDDRDAALAHAIDSSVRRRWLTLVAVLQTQLTRPWERVQAELQAVLLAGAAQLLLFERVPAHAVLHESVSWAKDHVRGKAGGLVNAVLRRIAELRVGAVEHRADSAGTRLVRSIDAPGRDELPLDTGHALRLSVPVFSEDPLERLAQQTSHVPELVGEWIRHRGEASARSIASHSLFHPPVILAGLAACGVDDHDAIAAAKMNVEPHEQDGFVVFSGDRGMLRSILVASPTIRVQDPGSADAVAATAALHPSVIVDVCAGRGTKTRQLAELHPTARIIASDADEARMKQLRETASELNQASVRSGRPNVEVVERRELRRFDERADLLVLDVPCSNTGVLARRPEAKYRYSDQSLKSLLDVQRQIIADSIPLLEPSGSLLYSTCSLDRAENQEQAGWIERWHRMRVIQSRDHLPQGLPGQSPTLYRDGGYWAVLNRSSR